MNAEEIFPYRNGNTCPDCGIPEGWEHKQWYEEGHGWRHDCTFSCSHFKKRIDDSPCKYCGKLNSPVRQVPAPVPFSDCYCEGCVAKCREEYMGFYEKRIKHDL